MHSKLLPSFVCNDLILEEIDYNASTPPPAAALVAVHGLSVALLPLASPLLGA
jgi:hypothetical protein